jgi:hypothetical protein
MSPVINEEKVEQEGIARVPATAADAGAAPARAPRTLAERAAGAVVADVIASPESLPFDRVSRQRLLVAQSAADTIERLSETGAWERLEPALAGHLIGQARRLSSYVTGLTQARPVRASEPALLLLRRLERRLQIAAELVEDEEERRDKEAAGGLFLGDFTENEPSGDDVTLPRQSAAKAGKPGKSAKGLSAAAAAGKRAWASKAERVAALRQSKRVMTYIGVAFAAVIVSAGYRMIATVQERPVRLVAPPVQFQPATYLSDVQIFLPATFTAQMGLDMTVVVSKEWLLRPIEKRVDDAAGAATFLLNRNVRKVRFQWEDGTPIVQFDQGVADWFDPTKMPGGGKAP